MPSYAWLLSKDLDFAVIPQRCGRMPMLGVPYDEASRSRTASIDAQKAGRRRWPQQINEYGSPGDLDDKKVMALIAYLERLGKRSLARRRPWPLQPMTQRSRAPYTEA